ncbi:MAG: ArnT family glycosyltransferase, partial [Litorivicinaceae bacterium]
MTTRLPLDWRFFLLLVLLGSLGTQVSLFDLDEGAFLEATRELLNGGHWAATTLDGEPRYDKPILTYWLQAASLTLLSPLSAWLPIELIGRFPSIIAGALWALVLGRYVCEQHPKQAVFVTLAVTTSLGVLVIARAATADALLNLWFALLFVDISRCLQAGTEGPRLRVYVWLALGV